MPAHLCRMLPFPDVNSTETLLATLTGDELWKLCRDTCLTNYNCIRVYLFFGDGGDEEEEEEEDVLTKEE